MEDNPLQPDIPILKVAWERFAQFDALARQRSKKHLGLRRWIASLGVLATLFAVLSVSYPPSFPAWGEIALRGLLVLALAVVTLLAFFAAKLSGGDGRAARSGAEEVLRTIFIYRSVLQKMPARRSWLEKRLVDIQRQVFQDLGGEMALPPYQDSDVSGDEERFNDLSGEDYFHQRLQNQLAGYIRGIDGRQRQRAGLRAGVLLAGAAGVILALLGGGLAVWAALMTAISMALFGWGELRGLDAAVKSDGKVIQELTVILDHWKSLLPEECTDAEFYTMVCSTEAILWSQNLEHIQAAPGVAWFGEAAAPVTEALRQALQADQPRQEAAALAAAQPVEAQREFRKEERPAAGDRPAPARPEHGRDEAERRPVSQRASLDELAQEFQDTPLRKETHKETLNAVLVRFPPSGEIKG